jgi:phage gp46-like protein
MPVDLEVSALGDLVFSGGRDLSVVRATDLLRQRMLLRLKFVKGSWRLNKTLGSELYTLLHQNNDQTSRARANSIVLQALRPMQEISVSKVDVVPDDSNPNTILVKVTGVTKPANPIAPPIDFQAEISVPIAPEPSEVTVRA